MCHSQPADAEQKWRASPCVPDHPGDRGVSSDHGRAVPGHGEEQQLLAGQTNLRTQVGRVPRPPAVRLRGTDSAGELLTILNELKIFTNSNYLIYNRSLCSIEES